jgi:hypothetical protein
VPGQGVLVLTLIAAVECFLQLQIGSGPEADGEQKYEYL